MQVSPKMRGGWKEIWENPLTRGAPVSFLSFPPPRLGTIHFVMPVRSMPSNPQSDHYTDTHSKCDDADNHLGDRVSANPQGSAPLVVKQVNVVPIIQDSDFNMIGTISSYLSHVARDQVSGLLCKHGGLRTVVFCTSHKFSKKLDISYTSFVQHERVNLIRGRPPMSPWFMLKRIVLSHTMQKTCCGYVVVYDGRARIAPGPFFRLLMGPELRVSSTWYVTGSWSRFGDGLAFIDDDIDKLYGVVEYMRQVYVETINAVKKQRNEKRKKTMSSIHAPAPFGGDDVIFDASPYSGRRLPVFATLSGSS